MPKNIPTEMYISKNAIAENPEHLTAAKRAFIVTGKHGAKASGALSDVTAVLDGAGIPYSVFDGVTENPSVGSAYRAGNEARAFGADTVIGIGLAYGMGFKCSVYLETCFLQTFAPTVLVGIEFHFIQAFVLGYRFDAP